MSKFEATVKENPSLDFYDVGGYGQGLKGQGDRVPLVLLSGGLDSTYLAYLLLQTTDIDILYIDGRQSFDKVQAEKKALTSIIPLLNEIGNHKVRNLFLFQARDSGFEHLLFQQAGYWFFGALQSYIGSFHSKVCMSYVQGDGINPNLHDFSKAWDHLTAAIKRTSIPLEFPLVLNSKEEILHRLPTNIRDEVWTCETPEVLTNPQDFVKDYKPCGKCVACVTLKVEKLRYSINHEWDAKRDPFYAEFVSKEEPLSDSEARVKEPESVAL